MRFFVRDGQFPSAFGTAGFDDVTTTWSGHTFTEAVLVTTFSVRWLEGTFHYICVLIARIRLQILGLQR